MKTRQLGLSSVVATGRPTSVPLDEAWDISKMLVFIPNASRKAASIFFVGYSPSFKYEIIIRSRRKEYDRGECMPNRGENRRLKRGKI